MWYTNSENVNGRGFLVKIASLEKIQIPDKFIGICCLGQFMGLRTTEREKALNVSFWQIK